MWTLFEIFAVFQDGEPAEGSGRAFRVSHRCAVPGVRRALLRDRLGQASFDPGRILVPSDRFPLFRLRLRDVTYVRRS